MQTRPILIIEGDVDDMQVIVHALKHSTLPNEILVTRDGRQAIDYLTHGSTMANGLTARPALIFVDLKLPERRGFNILADIRAYATTHYVPVVVLSSSDALADMQLAYDLGANSYVRKPASSSEFSEALRQVAAYWLIRNSTPRS